MLVAGDSCPRQVDRIQGDCSTWLFLSTPTMWSTSHGNEEVTVGCAGRTGHRCTGRGAGSLDGGGYRLENRQTLKANGINPALRVPRTRRGR